MLLNFLDIPVQQNPDERISYFKDFTLAVDLKGYDEVKVVGVGHGKFPDAPVYRRLIKRNAWILPMKLSFGN